MDLSPREIIGGLSVDRIDSDIAALEGELSALKELRKVVAKRDSSKNSSGPAGSGHSFERDMDRVKNVLSIRPMTSEKLRKELGIHGMRLKKILESPSFTATGGLYRLARPSTTSSP